MNRADHFHSSLLLLVGIGDEEFLTLALVLKRKIMASSYATHILPVFLWLHSYFNFLEFLHFVHDLFNTFILQDDLSHFRELTSQH